MSRAVAAGFPWPFGPLRALLPRRVALAPVFPVSRDRNPPGGVPWVFIKDYRLQISLLYSTEQRRTAL